MNTSLIRRLAAIGLAVGLTVGAGASFASAAVQAGNTAVPAYEEVDSIPMLRRPHSWSVIDDDTVIVWATPFDPYLVELAFRSPELKFAQAIVHDPPLLILDEPTAGLDPEERIAMLSRISILANKHGKTTIVSTHILPDVQAICENVIILSRGRVVIADRLEALENLLI